MRTSTTIKTISIISAVALAIGTAVPAFAIDVPAPGEQDGSGATRLKLLTDTAEYGGTEQTTGAYANPDADGDGLGDNLAFKVPSALNFVVKANGDLMCPSAAATYIQNESAYGIHVSSVDVDVVNTWNLVADASASGVTVANAVSMNVGPAMDSTETISLASYMSKTSLTNGSTKWGMSAKGAANSEDQLHLALDGKAKNLTATLSSATDFATIHWYLTAGGSGVEFIQGQPVTCIVSGNGAAVVSRSAATLANEPVAMGQTAYIVATPDSGYEVSEVSATEKADGDDIAVSTVTTGVPAGSTAYSFTMPDGGADVSVTFEVPPSLVGKTYAQLKTASEDIRANGSSSEYYSEYMSCARAATPIDVELKDGTQVSARLVDVKAGKGLVFMFETFPVQGCVNLSTPASDATCQGSWPESTLRADLNTTSFFDPYYNCERTDTKFATYLSSMTIAGTVVDSSGSTGVHPITTSTLDAFNNARTEVTSANDKFWLPAAIEIWGGYPAGSGNSSFPRYTGDEGTSQFVHFQLAGVSLTNKSLAASPFGSVSGFSTWLRSPDTSNKYFNNYLILFQSGGWGCTSANSLYAIRPCFCL